MEEFSAVKETSVYKDEPMLLKFVLKHFYLQLIKKW